MNLRDEILKEHSKSHTLYLANYIGPDQNRFSELMDLFFNGDALVKQRAAWVLSHSTDKYPHLVNAHIEDMLTNLQKEGHHDAIKRNTLRVLSGVEIPEELQGLALDITFEFLLSMKEKPAVKVFSMQVIYNISINEPDLLRELAAVIEDQMEYGTAGFKSRGKRILKAIRKIVKD